MNVLLISQCDKRALTESRRILDQFAERRGDRTWQTPITQDGLDTLRRLLRKTARKNTAVACHWIRGLDHSELLWAIGGGRRFNAQGAVPTNTTRHNHFFFDQPKVYFMHIGGMGEQVRTTQSTPASSFPGDIATPSRISPGPTEEVFATPVQASSGMVKVVIGRTAEMHGKGVGNEMGVNTWAAFAGSDEQAVVDGDFAIREDEVQTELKTLRGAGINIVAIHNHMTHETPRYFFLHIGARARPWIWPGLSRRP